MGFSSSVMKQAREELADTKKRHISRQQRNQEQIIHTVPRIGEIQIQLQATMAQVIAVSLRTGKDPSEAIQRIRDTNLALQAELSQLLAHHGYHADAMDEKPICSLCNDSGWQGTQMCQCLKALCNKIQIKDLSTHLDFGEQSFEQFDLTFYPTQHVSEWGRSPRDNMEKIFKICSDYAKNFGRYYFNNLFLSGNTGLGKTFLSASIARAVSESGHSVVYDTAGHIFAQFETQKFSRDDDETREARDGTRRYLSCDLLIMDDLGSEMTTPFVQSALYQLINSRLCANKSTVISSNLTMDDVRRRYSQQVASRLDGEYRVMPFFGDDIRILRKERM